VRTFLLIIEIHTLIFGFGFLIAGLCILLTASEKEEAQIESGRRAKAKGWFEVWRWYWRFRREFTSSSRIVSNLASRPDARKCLCVGMACLAVGAMLGFPLGAYT